MKKREKYLLRKKNDRDLFDTLLTSFFFVSHSEMLRSQLFTRQITESLSSIYSRVHILVKYNLKRNQIHFMRNS